MTAARRYFVHQAIRRTRDRRGWECVDCGAEADLATDLLGQDGCTRETLPCPHCGQAPECAPDCPGVLNALRFPEVYLAGSMGPKEGDA